ncbi:outer membrane protein transport protein [Pseudomonas sp. GM17]|uniref:OmpP1/FadL family transporter n=1 Tax=Pseudomonas sp. GM17 TaxID=1144323 RepID=UPI0002727260|nr:outer membrane protein transport protein [Pseudomonas sp. GM17]WIE49844.1 outer membrane protein transport protein [Pseudomonas sp. GM17]
MTIRNQLCLLGLCLTSTQLLANGLQINEQSISSEGKAYSGRASDVQDATIVYGNPAGMSKLAGEHVSGGLSFISVNSRISGVDTPVAGTSRGDMVPDPIVVPSAFYTRQLNQDWHVGFGVYAPFGGSTDYESSFQGRYRSSRTQVKVVTLQPTLSYRINDRLAVGFGPTINRIDGLLESKIDNRAVGGQGDGTVKVTGDDTALGFNLGILFDPFDDLTLGLTYHSRVKYNLKGTTRVTGANGLLAPIPALGLPGLNGKYDASLDFTTPETVDASLTWRVNERLDFSAGALWSRWSRVPELRVLNSSVPQAYGAFDSIVETLKWRDTWSFSTGASYRLNKQWKVRAGIAYEPTPMPNQYTTTRAPSGDRKIFTLGLNWQMTDRTSLDLGYGYIHEDAVKVSQATSQGGLRPAYSSTYHNSVNGLGLQMNYSF